MNALQILSILGCISSNKKINDDENEVENQSKLDWWPNIDANRVSLSQEEYIENQFLDVKDINHLI